jgi:hypothetical protein
MSFDISSNVTVVDKICFTNFVDLTRLEHLPWLISQPLVASTMIAYESLLEPLASLTENNHHKCNSRTSQKEFLTRTFTLRLVIIFRTFVETSLHGGN